MTRKKKKGKKAFDIERWLLQREVWGLVLATTGLITFIALTLRTEGQLSNAWAHLLRQVFGVGAFPVALLLIGGGVLLLIHNSLSSSFTLTWQIVVGAQLFFFGSLGLFHAIGNGTPSALASLEVRGGYMGWALHQFLVPLFGQVIAMILLTLMVFGGLYMALDVPWRFLFWRVNWLLAQTGLALRALIAARRERQAQALAAAPPSEPEPEPEAAATIRQRKTPQPPPEGALAVSQASGQRTFRSVKRPRTKRLKETALPPLDLLIADKGTTGDEADVRHKAQVIEETLAAFDVPAQVVEWNRGPVVTQFGIEPGYMEKGNDNRRKVSVRKILSLKKDLALALAAAPIRIEAPVPGRPVVGIEVPNSDKALVGLRGVLESQQFKGIDSPLRIALGRDVSGEPVAADLSIMPHLLIAGATGSGKSVCLNSIIVSLLFQNRPQALNLLLIDPKRVELTKYNGDPHLLAPVVVDVPEVIRSLMWLVHEMEERYKKFADAGVRNLDGYNKKAATKNFEPLPMIVVIIDELADLMLAAPDDAERTICRLAQMARATGIHLVIATQRPSVDVVTGLIKANFPSRISFAVSSQVDSRVILDSPGAENLLGRGDMLYMASDSPKLKRIQGCFVSDKEVEALVNFWRRQAIEEIALEKREEAKPWEDITLEEDPDKEILQEAIETIQEHDRASASFLQRKLHIGYPRAARLIDKLEGQGVVGPQRPGGRSRVVLAKEESDEDEVEAEPTERTEAESS
ncbi:MAG: DNA translocase FtsK [Chloroflexota bacterium]|nr:DNA translocase FtsK [Chloroflexota bacterium]